MGITWTLNARKKSFSPQSPQFLMVSGIGPSGTLKSPGIKVISDLASVGQNICLWYRTLNRWWFRGHRMGEATRRRSGELDQHDSTRPRDLPV